MDKITHFILVNNLDDFLKISFQITILAFIFFLAWQRIRRTQAEGLFKGSILLISFFAISYLAKFTIITAIIQHFIPFTLLAAVVIFQPEIRQGLNFLGHLKTFKFDNLISSELNNYDQNYATEQILQAVRELSRTKIGALIVVESPDSNYKYLSPGVKINADLSSLLLMTLFYPNSPLHDGAVIIRGNKIISAGVLLPMSETVKLNHRYGTRHRAAVGLSELYDGICIVVSEETGSVSVTKDGKLNRIIKFEELKDAISNFLNLDNDFKPSLPWYSFLNNLHKTTNSQVKNKL